MRMNPFRSEASAYHLVLFTICGLAAVVAGERTGVAEVRIVVPVLLAALAARALVCGRSKQAPERPRAIATHGEDGVRRILVVANETLGGAGLFREIRSRSEGNREQVLVLCPALNSALRHWLSDEDAARAAARRRLDASLDTLAAAGIHAHGAIGDANPLQAIEDALRVFGADEIIISTHPPERSNWLERGVVAKARDRFIVPVTHVIGEQGEVEPPPSVGVTSPA
jgi:GABA permease